MIRFTRAVMGTTTGILCESLCISNFTLLKRSLFKLDFLEEGKETANEAYQDDKVKSVNI